MRFISKRIALFRAKRFLKAWKDRDVVNMLSYCSKVYQEKKNYADIDFLTNEDKLVELVDYRVTEIHAISNVIVHVVLEIGIVDDQEFKEKKVMLRMIGMSEPYKPSRILGFGVEVGYLMRSILN